MREKDKGRLLLSEKAGSARDRAGIYAFLAFLFNQRVDADLLRRLRAEGVDSILTATQVEDTVPELEQGLHEIAQFVQDTADQPEGDVLEMMAVDWTRLLRGVSPAYGPSPPYEGLYVAAGSKGHETPQIISRCYSENGAAMRAECFNRPDYIGLELDFLRFLAEHEAEAWESSDNDRALDYQQISSRFLYEHPGRWYGSFYSTAIEYAETAFYRGGLLITRGIIDISMREGVAVGDE